MPGQGVPGGLARGPGRQERRIPQVLGARVKSGAETPRARPSYGDRDGRGGIRKSPQPIGLRDRAAVGGKTRRLRRYLKPSRPARQGSRPGDAAFRRRGGRRIRRYVAAEGRPPVLTPETEAGFSRLLGRYGTSREAAIRAVFDPEIRLYHTCACRQAPSTEIFFAAASRFRAGRPPIAAA